MLYWFFLQRIFTVLIVMILAWNLGFLTLVRLKCYFKKNEKKRNFCFFVFVWFVRMNLKKKAFSWVLIFRLKSKVFGFGRRMCSRLFFLLSVRLLKIGSPVQCKKLLYIGTLLKTLICMSQDTKWLCRIIFWNLIKW